LSIFPYPIFFIGKATGVVTTTRVTHASPAGVYAHVAERTWEDDSAVKQDGHSADSCPDIAQQLILGPTGSKLNVSVVLN